MNEEKIVTQQVESPPILPEAAKKEEETASPEYIIPEKNSGFNSLIYIVLFFIIFGITIFLGWKYVIGEKIMNQFFPTPTPTPTVQVASPTVIITQGIIASPSASIATTSAEMLNYSLPSGWRTIKSSDEKFEVGFDPRFSEAKNVNGVVVEFIPADPRVVIRTHTDIRLLSYGGGSRHQFIYTAMNATPTEQDLMPGYFEKDYNFDGKSCLFLNRISVSQFPGVWGMCDAGSGKAFLITSWDEPIKYLETVKTIRKLIN